MPSKEAMPPTNLEDLVFVRFHRRKSQRASYAAVRLGYHSETRAINKKKTIPSMRDLCPHFFPIP